MPRSQAGMHVEVWEERDRLHIALYDDDDLVAEWWDDDARQMFEDGFFERGRNLTKSVIEYAESVGMLPDDGDADDDYEEDDDDDVEYDEEVED